MAEPIKIIVTQGSGDVGAKGTPTVSGYSGPSVRTGEMKFGGELDVLNAQTRAENIAKAKKNLGKAGAVAGAVAGLAVHVMSASLDTMSDLTGNYVAQRRFNETMGIVSKGIKAGGIIAGGAMIGGAVGAVVGAGIAYTEFSFDAINSYIVKPFINIINTNMHADLLRGQSGNGNGSRGTHD